MKLAGFFKEFVALIINAKKLLLGMYLYIRQIWCLRNNVIRVLHHFKSFKGLYIIIIEFFTISRVLKVCI